jgi:hypothetical protein
MSLELLLSNPIYLGLAAAALAGYGAFFMAGCKYGKTKFAKAQAQAQESANQTQQATLDERLEAVYGEIIALSEKLEPRISALERAARRAARKPVEKAKPANNTKEAKQQ